MGLGLAYQKTTFWTKIGGGVGEGSIQQKFGTPYVFLQPLKLATSNLVHNLGLGLAYQKTTFRIKIAKVASKKMWDSLCIFGTVEASNFKFGTQIAFGTSLAKTDGYDQNWRGYGLGAHKQLGPILISATVETSNFKFGIYNLGLGLVSYQKNNV